MEKYIVAISTLIFGGVIGYFSSLFLERRKNQISFNIKIFELYDKISQEIISVLIEMTTLSLRMRVEDVEDIEQWRKKISGLYFKYYNYLPQGVLNEMNCLHSCLSTKGKYIYKIDSKNEHRIIRSADKKEIISFFDDATLVSHDNRLTKLIERHGIDRFPNSIKINFQARRVIRRIDDFWGNENLYKWMNNLKKNTIFQNGTNK